MQQGKPFLEYVLSELRFNKALSYIKEGSVVGDFGCGFRGNFLKKISKKIKLGIGYDISVKNENLPKNITLKTSDLNKKIDNKKNYFDCIAALAVIEHVKNPQNFILQAKIMLKKEGVIIITTPHKKGKNILTFFSSKLDLISKGEIEDHKTYFDEKSIRYLLKEVGFKMVEITTFEFGMNIFCVAQKT